VPSPRKDSKKDFNSRSRKGKGRGTDAFQKASSRKKNRNRKSPKKPNASRVKKPTPGQIEKFFEAISIDHDLGAVKALVKENRGLLHVKFPDDSFNNCVMVAAREDLPDFIDFFLDEGVDIDAVNEKKETAALLAGWMGSNLALRKLIDRGANLKKLDESKKSALYNAAQASEEITTNMLLDACDDPKELNIFDDLGDPLAFEIISMGNAEILQKALEKGMDIHVKHRDDEDDTLWERANRLENSDEIIAVLDTWVKNVEKIKKEKEDQIKHNQIAQKGQEAAQSRLKKMMEMQGKGIKIDKKKP